MSVDTKAKFLLIASFPELILTFRGPLITSLLSRGLDVHVAAPGLAVGSVLRNDLEAKGIRIHNIPLQRTGVNPLKDFFLLWRLFRLMRRIRPEFVLGYTIKPVIYGLIAAWLTRIPNRYALITGLGFAFTSNRGGIVQSLIKRLYQLALVRADKVFFQNPDDRALFRDLGILADKVASVVVNGSVIRLN